MSLNLTLCPKADKKIIADLCQFYFYDLDAHSKLANIHYDNGHYKQMAYFENYWHEKNRFPYLIYKNHIPIGFALVHNISVNPKADWKLAEFFIMAPYKRQGIGAAAIEQLFEKHQGMWEISVLKDNMPAIKFWGEILSGSQKSTHDAFQNYVFFEISNEKRY
jgi:predicted acetyltransferase